MMAVAERPVSAATERANAFVEARLADAAALGRSLGDLVNDPDAFVGALEAGFERLADPEYQEGQHFIAPGLGPVLGVRRPLMAAAERGLRTATRGVSPSALLFVADRLFRSEPLELRWFAFGILDRTLPAEPERTWQLLRRASREADDWITVDTLAHPVARGVLNEPYRWAELEQLVFSPSRWERRLVGSTVATMPFADRRRGRLPDVLEHGLALVSDLIGDSEPDVQKALSWALRSLAIIDQDAVAAFCADQSAIARETDDGHRAWVLRDTIAKLPVDAGATIRSRLDGIRRRPGAPSTSRAATTAAQFAGMGLGRDMPEPPLT